MCFRLRNDFTAITSAVLATAGGATLPSHTHASPRTRLQCLLTAGGLAAGEACPKEREVVRGLAGPTSPQQRTPEREETPLPT